MARRRQPVHGKVVLITGAARGIGAGTAKALAERGARVSLVGLEPEELERVAGECGPDAAWFEADVTDSATLRAAVEGTVSLFGRLDVAIANAGVGPVGMLRETDEETFERTMDINVNGAFRTMRACLPHLIERRGYAVIVASLASIAQLPGMGAYGTSKAGVEALGDVFRAELAHLGVDVGVAYFSWIDTDMVHGGLEHPGYRRLRDGLKGPFSKTYPISDAIDAMVGGVEGRAARIAAPGWIGAARVSRGLVRDVGLRDALSMVPDLDRLFREHDAGAPVDASAFAGPGGEAAQRSAAAHD